MLGDSHAEHLLHGLRQHTLNDLIDMTSPGCIPFRDVDRYDDRFHPEYVPNLQTQIWILCTV